jgi:selenocysteine lyase/cysteine desulfurase
MTVLGPDSSVSARTSQAGGQFDVEAVLAYLDSAATSQKPQVVIDALVAGLERMQDAFG